jgi:hypothetical protein
MNIVRVEAIGMHSFLQVVDTSMKSNGVTTLGGYFPFSIGIVHFYSYSRDRLTRMEEK